MTRRTTTSLTTLAATGFLASMAAAQGFNDAAPNGAAYDQKPAFEGQTRAPMLDSTGLQQQVLVELRLVERGAGFGQTGFGGAPFGPGLFDTGRFAAGKPV